MSGENNSSTMSVGFLSLAIAYFIWAKEWDRKFADENPSNEPSESESGNSQN